MRWSVFVLVCPAIALLLCPTDAAATSERGEWILNPETMPFDRHRGYATCTHGNRVYILGGDSTGVWDGHLDYAGFAELQGDGTLGPWTQTTHLPEQLWIPQAIQYEDWIFLIAGRSPGASRAEVYRTEVESDGTLGAWQPQNPLPDARYGHVAARHGNRIYVLGNWIYGVGLEQVYMADISASGELGPWHTTTPLPACVYASDAAIIGNRLFIFGGKELIGNEQTVVPKVRYAEIESDGHLGSWVLTDSMPQARWFHQIEVFGRNVFVVGGSEYGPVEEVAEGSVSENGHIAWRSTGTIPNPTSGNGLVQLGSRLYYLPGGWDTRIYFTHVATTGTHRYTGPFPNRRYFLLSLPLVFPAETHLSTALAALGPDGLETWRCFGWSNGRLQEDPVLSTGAGYWLAVNRVAPTIEINGYLLPAPLEVALTPGWNIVGVPTPGVPLDWSQVIVRDEEASYAFGSPGASAVIAPYLQWWDDSSGDNVNNGSYIVIEGPTWGANANPWGGYLSYAYEPATLVFPSTALAAGGGGQGSIPTAGSGAAGSGRPSMNASSSPCLSHDDWFLSFAVESGDSRDGNLKVGVREGGVTGYDLRDVFKAPMPGDGVRLAVVQDGGPWEEFLSAWEDPAEAEYEWILRLAGVRGNAARVHLSWSGVETLPAGWQAYLMDPESELATDLASRSTQSFVSNANGCEFRIRVTRSEVGQDELVPASSAITGLGPNPTDKDVRIDYALASGGPVRLRILDPTGRQVASLVDSHSNPGRFSRVWQSATAGSGVYFVSLDSDGGSETRKLVLLK